MQLWNAAVRLPFVLSRRVPGWGWSRGEEGACGQGADRQMFHAIANLRKPGSRGSSLGLGWVLTCPGLSGRTHPSASMLSPEALGVPHATRQD